jgi:hypothetical protein
VRRDRSALTCANVEQRFTGMVKAVLGEAGFTRAARVGSAVTTSFGNGVLTEVRADGVRIVELQQHGPREQRAGLLPWVQCQQRLQSEIKQAPFDSFGMMVCICKHSQCEACSGWQSRNGEA